MDVNPGVEDAGLKMLGHAWDLPAIVFAVELIGKQVQLGLYSIQIFDWTGLPRLQLNFFHLSVQADRLNRPSALLQALRCAVRIGLVREKEIMVELRGIAERFVQFFVLFRAFWAWSEE